MITKTECRHLMDISPLATTTTKKQRPRKWKKRPTKESVIPKDTNSCRRC
uniref:Uncharacterized protein n=1 Tax=Arundo donax TaxID=35708 RepID=A0A0A8ZCQ8_ARUDO